MISIADKIRLALILCLFLLLTGFAVQPPDGPPHIQLEWSVPTVREDGSPVAINEVRNYELSRKSYAGTMPDDEVVMLLANNLTSVDLGPLWPATHEFKIRAVAFDSSFSSWSPVVTVQINQN